MIGIVRHSRQKRFPDYAQGAYAVKTSTYYKIGITTRFMKSEVPSNAQIIRTALMVNCDKDVSVIIVKTLVKYHKNAIIT